MNELPNIEELYRGKFAVVTLKKSTNERTILYAALDSFEDAQANMRKLVKTWKAGGVHLDHDERFFRWLEGTQYDAAIMSQLDAMEAAAN